jgi:hypothetical protein
LSMSFSSTPSSWRRACCVLSAVTLPLCFKRVRKLGCSPPGLHFSL